MAYVEFLRVRQALLIYTGIIAGVVALLLIGAASAHPGGPIVIDVGAGRGEHAASSMYGIFANVRIPLGALLGIAGYCAVVFATVLASSLNKENMHANFSFTKPIARQRLGLAYFGVDAAGIALSFAIAYVLICFLPLLVLGALSHVYVDSQGIWIGALGLAIAVMWYGILQAVTAGYSGHGGVAVGVSWAFFSVLAGLSQATFLGPALLGIVHAANLLNPLAYFTSLTQQGSGDAEAQSVLHLALQPRVFLACAVAVVAAAVALARQKRLEV